MAVFAATRAFDSTELQPFLGEIKTATAKRIDIAETGGSAYISYAGSFTYSGGYLSKGSVTKLTYMKDGLQYFTVTGKFDALLLSNALDNAYYQDDITVLQEFLYSGNDTFNGSSGNDYLNVDGGGTDKILAGAGNEIVSASIDAKSSIDGGSGNDFISTYGNSDTISGGLGNDIFSLSAANPQKALIKDFQFGADRVQFYISPASSIIPKLFDGSEFGDSWLEFYAKQIAVGKGVKSALDSDDILAYDTSTGMLYLDEDGVGGSAGIALVQFYNKPTLTAQQLADNVLYVKVVGSQTLTGLFSDFLSNEFF